MKTVTPILKPRSKREQHKTRSLVDVTLDAAQKKLVELPPTDALLVLGEAGYGKTTVALWRLAHLARANAKMKDRPRFRAAVIVPSEGLRRLLQSMLTKMGIDVLVHVYEKWAVRQARRVFVDIPRRESSDASAGTIRIKRERALSVGIDELASRPRPEFDDDDDRPKIQLDSHAGSADLLHLFGDRALMEKVAAAATPPISLQAVTEILEHTHVQFSRTTEEASRHVDKRRLRAVDALALDHGTTMHDAGTIDAEDYAVLFEIDRRRAEKNGAAATAPRPYDCLVIDEAQELAPLELALIGRSLAPNGTLIVAGDADQQVDASASFVSWQATMKDLRCDAYVTATLEVGYRCPPEITAFARSLLGPKKIGDSAIMVDSFEHERDLGKWLDDALSRLLEGDPNIAVAIITRQPATARRIADLLSETPRRLVLDGTFTASKGVVVTSVDQVKGLELDTVIVPDASDYPDASASRHALYVAATRARHQLVVVGSPFRS